MKRSERYHRDATYQFALAALCLAAVIAIVAWLPFNAISFGIMGGLIASYILTKTCRFIVEGGNLRRLAKQSETAEINRAIRPRL